MKRVLEPFRSSIRRWLLWVLLPSLGGAIGVNVWLQYLMVDRPIHEAFDHALHDDAHAVAAHLRVDAQGLRFEMEPEAERVLRTDPEDFLFFLVRGPAGEYLGGERDLSVPPESIQGRALPFDATYRGEAVRGVTHVHPTALGQVTIHVAETKRARSRLDRELAWAIFLSNGLLLLITLGLAYAVVGAGLRPLLRLSRDIGARGTDMLTPVSHNGLPAELQPLVRALNRLLSVIDGSTRAQRPFLADASHQLRTPLAGLQGQLELLSHEDLPDAARERIVELHDAVRRLSHLSGRLLALGRSDALADPSMQMEPGDLADMVEACASIFLDRALAKNIDLGFEAESAPICGCPWMIREMVSNLIDNAIAYTAAGGRITVRSRVRDGGAVLEVEDNGRGIPAPERERVFERFYRGRDYDGIGCGLGLSIVRQIADAHDATVRILDPESGQGTLFRVRFPALAASACIKPAH
jgi:two-component system sensor histidine kinase TctE